MMTMLGCTGSLKAIGAGLVGTSLLLAGLIAGANGQAAQIYRIGYVSLASPNEFGEKAFREGLREAGYVEGENIFVEARFARGHHEPLSELVAGVIAQKVDVLVVSSTRTALAAKKATTTIPIVFASVFDPVAAGLVTSLARPGGNITGSAIGVGEGFGGKWMELLKDAVPSAAHIAVLWNSANESSAQSAREIQAAARSLNVKLDMFDARTPASLDKAFVAIGGSRAQGLIVAPDPYFNANRAKIVQFAESKRLPAVYFFTSFVEVGGFMAYGPIHAESFRAAARYVDKILKGAIPADLPVERPTKFELVINRKTARALGLTISPSLLVRADRIID